MELDLSNEQAVELRDLLAGALADLHSEVHHTDSVEYRARLQRREGLLRALHEQLERATATPAR